MLSMLDTLSLKNTRLGLETLDLMGYEHERTVLVLNRADSRVGISDDDVERIVGRKPEVRVPSDVEITRSVNDGRPIVLSPSEVGGRAVVPAARGRVHGARRARRRERRSTSRTQSPTAKRGRLASTREEDLAVDLHERLTTARPAAPAPGRDDPFAELKNRVHLAVIGVLGPRLFNAGLDPAGAARAGPRRHAPPPRAGSRASRATTASGSPPRSRTTPSATARSSACSRTRA